MIEQNSSLFLRSVEEFLEQTSIIWNKYENKPYPNSQASKELVMFSRPESIGTAYSQGVLLIEVAADYAYALLSTLTEPAQTIAPWACARGCLEASALSMWLLDTKIQADERVKRSLAFRYEGNDQQAKFARSTKGAININDVTARIDEIEQVAHYLGFSKVKNKNNKRIGIGQKMPTITQIVIDMLDKEQNYRLLSAMVHAHPWALQVYGFKKTQTDKMIFESVKGAYFEKHLSLESIEFLCVEVIEDLFKAMLTIFNLNGWDIKLIAIVANNAIKKINLS